MANIKLIDALTSGSTVVGTPETSDGNRTTIHIFATSYGTDGKVVLKASSDGVNFTTLEDPATTSGLAEYSANIIFNMDKPAQGWSIRADLEITSGTATAVNVIMGS
jgi:hypothetical protein